MGSGHGRIRSFSIVLVGVLAGIGASAPATLGQGSPPPSSGGTLVMGEWAPPDALQPFFSIGTSTFDALGPVLRGLYTTDNDGQWVPDLGVEIPSVENGDVAKSSSGDEFTVTLKLKPGLQWSDGTPLTMNDFKATYDWAVEVGKSGVGCSGCASFVPLIDPALCVTKACKDGTASGPTDLAAQFAPENQYVKDIAVSDDGLTATVTWRKPFASWLGWAATQFLQRAWLAGVAPDAAAASMPLGPGVETVPWSGPFTIASAGTDGIDYAPNPNWHGGTATRLDGLRMRYYADKDAMITAFLSGEIDLSFQTSQIDYPALAAVDPSVGRVTLDPAWQYQHFDINTSHKNVGLDDPNVRKAIAMAIDKQDLMNVLFPGMGIEPACNGTPPGTWWRDDSVSCVPYDPSGAMALLDQAGWKLNPDTGLREKDVDGDGTPEQMRLRLCTSSGNQTRVTELGKLNQYLAAIGIPSDVQTVDATSVLYAGWADTTPTTECSIYRGTYDIADFAYVMSSDVYGDYFWTYDSSQIPSAKNPNGSNDTRIAVPALDQALADLATQIDPAQQKADAATIQQVLADQNNEIPFFYRSAATGVSNHVGGWTRFNPSTAGPTWNAETWWYMP
jgi:peptide/nickel transport system substrate-binding protein